jgi:hypothetical protein
LINIFTGKPGKGIGPFIPIVNTNKRRRQQKGRKEKKKERKKDSSFFLLRCYDSLQLLIRPKVFLLACGDKFRAWGGM